LYASGWQSAVVSRRKKDSLGRTLMKKNSLIYWIIFISCGFHLRGAQSEWLTDLPTALAKAKAENKNVLVDFTGSDWCGWCIRLKKEVFDQPEFVAYAQEKLVLVELDFPNQKPQTRELKAANQTLSEKFGVTGYPTIFVLDADGNKLIRGGYLAGGAANYITALEKINKPSAVPVAPPQKTPAPTPPPKTYSGPIHPAPVIRYTELTLKGITGSKNRRFALINNQTMAIGEKAKVKLGDGHVEVLCQEIRDDSVLIKVENEVAPKELKLKSQ
jgi:thioredoxin-related protein